MEKTVKVHCLNNDKRVEFPMGTSLLEVLDALKIESKYPIMNARVNNRIEGLTHRIYGNKTIKFIDLSQASGMRTYIRALSFILVKAVDQVFPREELRIEHSVSKGYFCRLVGRDKVTQAEVDKIKEKMHECVAENIPFEKVEDETSKIVELFRKEGLEDKALLLETSGNLYSTYDKMGNNIDYYYGCLPPSTGYVKLFGLETYHNGMLLRIPNRKNPIELEPVINQDKMFGVFEQHLHLLDAIGLKNVGELNQAHQTGHMGDAIKIAEAMQERMISDITDDIARRKDDGVKVVLIAGPSSSGKTTFRMRLEVQLMTRLIRPVGLSLDDYFINRDNTPLDEDGEYDFESLYALDLAQFNKDLEALLRGELVELPTYNFAKGEREYKGKKLQLKEDSMLIIEGIHGLNPELTPNIPDKQKYKVYISALTTISLDNHNSIPTTDNRLLRRMIRDCSYRNYPPADTIARWASVRRGEDKWIFPYQENADAMFNSAMIYELAALRPHAERVLSQVPNNVPEYAEAHRLLKFVRYFKEIDDKELPPTSLLREFLGGSSFKY